MTARNQRILIRPVRNGYTVDAMWEEYTGEAPPSGDDDEHTHVMEEAIAATPAEAIKLVEELLGILPPVEPRKSRKH